MPNIKSAKKRLRQAEKRRERNRRVRSQIRTRTRKLLSIEDADAAEEALRDVVSLLDRAARKNVIPPNAAARRKSRLHRYVQSLRD